MAVPVSGANIISLAPDASIFAVGTANEIRIYSTADVLANKSVGTPLRCDTLGGFILDIQWRPQQFEYAALVSSQVHLVNVTTGVVRQLESAPENAACISWSPDGKILAIGAGDGVVFCDVDNTGAGEAGPLCTVQVISQDVAQDDGQALLVEGLRYLSANSILVLSRLLEEGAHTDLAPCGILSWPVGQYPQDAIQLTLAEFFAMNLAPPSDIEESSFTFSVSNTTDSDLRAPPCLVSATVSGWGANVFTHMHAYDDHIKIVEQQQDLIQGIEVTDDKLAIRIPNAPGDANNYVVGLGFDLSLHGAGGIAVEHPTDDTAPDLQPQPVLWVATSDGVLRAYSFGSTKDRPGVVQSTDVALPAAPKIVNNVADEDNELEKEKSNVPSDVAAAAAAALPESESDFEEEEEEGEIEVVTAKEPEPKPVFGFASPPIPATVAPPPALPAFSFAGPSPSSQPTSFGFVAAPPAAPAAIPKPPPPVLPPPAAASAAKPLPVEVEEEESEEAPEEPRPARSQTAIVAPAARLQDAGEEAATLERDFLKSLEETRSLEASIHDAIADALRGAHAVVGSQADFEKLRHQVYTLQSDVTDASETLAGLRGEFEALALGVKEGYMRMEAMPAFQPSDHSNKNSGFASSTPGSGGSSGVVDRTLELRRKQPLDPALGSLRDSARAHVRALSQKLDEVKECVAALEDNYRRARTGEQSYQSQVASTPQAQALALYEAINAQSAVIQAQTAKLYDVAASIKGSGIMMKSASLEFDEFGSIDDFSTNVLTYEDGLDSHNFGNLGVRRSSTISNNGISPASSSLVHVDSSKKSRVPWQSVRTSPGIVRRLSSSSSQALTSPLSLSSPLGGGAGRGGGVDTSSNVTFAAWKGDALSRDILRRCKGLEGGIRVTEVSGMPSTPPLKLKNSDRSGAKKAGGQRVLPPLKPLVLPELPEPYMPAPPKATSSSRSKSSSLAAVKPAVFKLNVAPPAAAAAAPAPFAPPAVAPAAPSLIPRPKSSASTSSSGSQQPPLPSFAQVKAATALKANVLGGAKEKVAPAAPAAADVSKPKPKPASSQPPLPSFGQLAAAQDLQAKAAAAQAAQARFAASTAPAAAEKKKEESKEEKTETTKSDADGLNFNSFGFGSAATTAPASTAATDSSSVATTASSPFGASKGISFGAPAASTAASSPFGAAPASGAASSPFGALSTPAPASSAAASLFGAAAPAAASTSPFGAASSSAAQTTPSPFGAAAAAAATTSSGFGQPSAFGAAAATPAPASTPAVASPFGTPSGFGAAATPAASQPSFGAAFGAPASPAGAFGSAATGGGGGLFGASPAPAAAAVGGAFGQPSAFGKPSAFGQPSAFGAAATPAASSAFGQPSAFGQAASPASNVFGQAATPAASGGGFGSFATQPSGFSSFAQQSGAPAAPTGFGAMSGGGASGFGAFGGGAPAATPPKPAGGGNMWAPRK